jgi:glycosyltransferase involved in cell wall biosynthesis
MDIVIGTTSLLAPITGVGRYTERVIRHLALISPEHSYSYHYGFFTSETVLRGTAARASRVVHDQAARLRPLIGALRQVRNGMASLSERSYDVYFEPNFALLPLKAKHRVVMVPDFAFHMHPEWQPRDRVEHLRRRFFSTVPSADAIVTLSRFVKEQAADILKTDGATIAVVPAGVDHALFRKLPKSVLGDFRRRWNLPRRFILSVGSLEPRKNLLRLLEAHEALPHAVRREHPLVLAGARGWSNAALRSALQSRRDVRYLGYVTDVDLACLYNLATLFAYPSLYEGFGLPPLEAMACGTPTTTSRTGSLPEVVGPDGAYFDPSDVEEMAVVMQRLLEDEDTLRRLSESGMRRARRFRWEDTSRGLLTVIQGERTQAPLVSAAT